jgi:small multidrug resistance pump
MSWVYLVLAILFEVGGTTSMKLSENFTRWIPSVAIFVLYGLSLVGMTLALKRIEMGIVYAVWSGVGTALIAIIGVMYFNEEMGFIKIVSLVLIVAGVVGLNLTGGGR